MDKLPIPLVKLTLEFLEPDIPFIIYTLKNDTYKQWISPGNRYVYYEYSPKYKCDALGFLGTPRNYKELLGLFKGHIRNKDWEALETFDGYKADFVSDVIRFSIEYQCISSVITLLIKFRDLTPINYRKRIREFYILALKQSGSGIIYDYFKLRYNHFITF